MPRMSQLENKFAALLRSMGIEYKRQFKLSYGFKNRYYDFYLPEYNLVIEVQGDYFHGNENKFGDNLSKMQLENKENDVFKKNLAKIQNYEYLDVWENQINNFPNKVKKKVYDKINNGDE